LGRRGPEKSWLTHGSSRLTFGTIELTHEQLT